MMANTVSGIIFANVGDNYLKKLTAKRSIASVPFGARYRLIDFSLSNLVNAGVSNVGIITKENYRSLMDHVGSGIYWDLDRRKGGLHILPPYITRGMRRYNGSVDALFGARDFIKRAGSEHIVLCDAHILANIDVSAAVKAHIKNDADITLVYHSGAMPDNIGEAMILKLEDDNKVSAIKFRNEAEIASFSIGVTIIKRELLLQLVDEAHDAEYTAFNHDVIAKKVNSLKIYGFEHADYIKFMSGTDGYYTASMDLLNPVVRKQLFNADRPIYTKTRDDMPTRYGTKSKVTNSLVADGCVIEGTVRNSVIFRGVKVEAGAVVENCILMQETFVGKNAQLDNVIADKNSTVGEGLVIKGNEENHFFIKKNETV